jgi:hypothetical protein
MRIYKEGLPALKATSPQARPAVIAELTRFGLSYGEGVVTDMADQ